MKRMAPVGQASVQSVQNRHRPRSNRGPPLVQADRTASDRPRRTARQPSRHWARSITGRPRKRSGSVGGWRRVGDRAMSLVQACKGDLKHGWIVAFTRVVSAIRKIETLVAQRKVGNLLVAQGHRQADQLWNDGSTIL